MKPPLIYDNFKYEIAVGGINLASSPLAALLVDSNYKPSAKHATLADVKGEVVGKGYIDGGKTLTGVALRKSGGSVFLTADNPSWPKASITATGVIVYELSTQKLIMHGAFGGERSSSDGDFDVEWNAQGLLEIFTPVEKA